MLLQRLVEYEHRMEPRLPYGYAMAAVRYEIHLTAGGAPEPPGMVDLTVQDGPRDLRRAVPNVQRAGSAASALLFADRADYTLGIARELGDEANAQENHTAYVELVRACAEDTGSGSARAVLAFLTGAQRLELVLPENFDAAARIEFRVEGRLVTQEEAVRDFWETHTCPKAGVMQCAVCGRNRPPLETMQGRIRGVPGGNGAGTVLVSANAEAFFSYGRRDARISPICGDCADSFTKALNALLADREHCIKSRGAACVFWAVGQVGLPVHDLLGDPDAQAVRELLAAHRAGGVSAFDLSPFYAACLSANNARIVVRDWFATTLGEVKGSLALWFQRQRIVGAFGDERGPLGLHALVAPVAQTPDVNQMAGIVSGLFRSALTGEPLPARLLERAVGRCRAEGDVTYPRAALLKMALLSGGPSSPDDALVALGENHPDPAYHCGRLLALVDAAQRQSFGSRPTAGVAARWYSAASGSPAAVFDGLLRSARRSLTRSRRTRPGLAGRFEREFGRATTSIGAFPATLPTRGQALFALGFYHQRAHERAAALDHSGQGDPRASASQPNASLTGEPEP